MKEDDDDDDGVRMKEVSSRSIDRSHRTFITVHTLLDFSPFDLYLTLEPKSFVTGRQEHLHLASHLRQGNTGP